MSENHNLRENIFSYEQGETSIDDDNSITLNLNPSDIQYNGASAVQNYEPAYNLRPPQTSQHYQVPDNKCVDHSNLLNGAFSSFDTGYSNSRPSIPPQFIQHIFPLKYEPNTPSPPSNEYTTKSLPDFSHSIVSNDSTPTNSGDDNLSMAGICSTTSLGKYYDRNPSLPQGNFSLSQTPPNNRISTESIQNFLQFVPCFNQTNAKTLPDLVVKVLRVCLPHIPLDDFFNSLSNFSTLMGVAGPPTYETKIDGAQLTESTPKSLELCCLVLETFRNPNFVRDSFNNILVNNPLLITINFDEVIRTFLAIKVIFDTIRIAETNLSDFHIPRISVYKAYYIVCKRLMHNYSTSKEGPETQKNLILTHPQFGKLMKFAFPNLTEKRLGKRNQSTFHYVGIIWNNLVIREDIKLLLELSIPDIENLQTPGTRIQKEEENEKKGIDSRPVVPVINKPTLDSKLNQNLMLPHRKPLYSFVYLSNTLIVSNCFLRLWEFSPGMIPQQSPWSEATMWKSVGALKYYGIDILPLVFMVPTAEFSNEIMESFLEQTLLMIHLLISSSLPDETFLHVFIVVSLLIAPVAFSSNKEVTFEDKELLRTSLTNFVTRLEYNLVGISLVKLNNIMGFTKIIRKMIGCNNSLLSRVVTPLVKDVIRIMGGGAQMAGGTEQALAMEQGMIKVIQHATITACNALSWKFVETHLNGSSSEREWIILKITKRYMEFSKTLLKRVSEIPNSMINDDFDQPTCDLPYRIFSELVQALHTVFMFDPLVLRLPIKLVELIVTSITNEFQKINFQSFGSLDHDLSKEIFKTWWVYSTAIQDYMSTISEIVALSLRVS